MNTILKMINKNNTALNEVVAITIDNFFNNKNKDKTLGFKKISDITKQLKECMDNNDIDTYDLLHKQLSILLNIYRDEFAVLAAVHYNIHRERLMCEEEDYIEYAKQKLIDKVSQTQSNSTVKVMQAL